MTDTTERVAQLHADADQTDRDSQRWRTTHPLTYHTGQLVARILRWRANDLAAYATSAGRRRSGRRWFAAAIVVASLGAADRIAHDLWHWPDLSPVFQLAAFIAMGVGVQARGWADGYEARDGAAAAGERALAYLLDGEANEPDLPYCHHCGHACNHTPRHELVDGPGGPMCKDKAACVARKAADG